MHKLSDKTSFKRDTARIKRLFSNNKDVDIIALQEVGPLSESIIKRVAKGRKIYLSKKFDATHEHLYFLVSSWLKKHYKISVSHGVVTPAILGITKPKEFSIILKRKRDKQSKEIWPKKFAVINTHIIYGNSKSERFNEVSALNHTYTMLSTTKLIDPRFIFMIGDFNLNPSERHPDKPNVTFESFLGGKGLNLCSSSNATTVSKKGNGNIYDHLITSRFLVASCQAKVREFRNDTDHISDHLPVRFDIYALEKTKKPR